MSETHHIYLVPGFFGFVNFGRVVYFTHVREFLEEALGHLGLEVEIHRARISPTASLRHRAAQLAELIVETSPRGPIHIIGHSTGGLDARLFVTPGVSLGIDAPVEEAARRVRSVVSLATPHHGTPLASFFMGILGQRLLSLLSISTVAVLREGRLPLSLVARAGAALTRVVLPGGTTEAVLDHLVAELMGRLPPDDRDQIGAYFTEIGRDRSLLPQLMPEGIDMFNAACAPRPGVTYASVVARARRPRWTGHLRLGAPNAQLSYLAYRWLHDRSGKEWGRGPILDERQRTALVAGFGEVPRSDDSDGVVPTLSQVHGDVIAAVEADHLDIIGHFDDGRHQPPHRDWLSSGSRFDRAGFEALWRTVVARIAPSSVRRGWRGRLWPGGAASR